MINRPLPFRTFPRAGKGPAHVFRNDRAIGLRVLCSRLRGAGGRRRLQGDRPARPAADAPTRTDPTKVMGYTACSDCHKAEIAAWKASRHAVNFEKTLSTDKAKEYASKMNITEANITREGMCVDCHGQKALTTPNHSITITGASCESCHGAAGGEDGWLNPHGSYGAKGLLRAGDARTQADAPRNRR